MTAAQATTTAPFIKEWAELLERIQCVTMQLHVPHFTGWSTTSDEQCKKTLFLIGKTQEILLLVSNQAKLFDLERSQRRMIEEIALEAGAAWVRLDEYYRKQYNACMTPPALALREEIEKKIFSFMTSLDDLVIAFLYDVRFFEGLEEVRR